MIKGIGHIGIAVKNIEETLTAISKALDLPVPPIKDIPERKRKVALLDIGGTGLEFIHDYNKEGEISKFLKGKENRIHHICLLTDKIETDIEILKSRGIEMVEQKPRMGGRGKRVASIKPSSFNGLPFQLSEP